MGLDMYLSKRHYVKRWDHQDTKDKHEITIKKGDKVVDTINAQNISEVIEDICYWRKANQIHKWFVDNVVRSEDYQGNDEYVSKGDLEKLLAVCKQVVAGSELVEGKIKNGQKIENGKWVDVMQDGKYIKDSTLARELLPTERGFFFGGTDYDEYYLSDLTHTITELEKALAVEDSGTFYYSASW